MSRSLEYIGFVWVFFASLIGSNLKLIVPRDFLFGNEEMKSGEMKCECFNFLNGAAGTERVRGSR